MIKLFTEHPDSVGETYAQHLAFATRFGGHMILGGAACFVHGLLPFLFTSTGSRTVLALHARMMRSRARQRHAPPAAVPEPDYLI
jgi:hypothetical protein